MSEQNPNFEESLNELRTFIKEGMNKEGIEETIIQMGISFFQVESVLQELLARLVATQRVLVEKGLVEEAEIEASVHKTIKEQEQLIEQATKQFLEGNQENVS
jgi:hypothetical protein